MFQDVLYVPERNGRVRAAVLPLSVLAHGLLALLLVAAPFVRSGNLPRLELRGVFLAPAPPAPPPPPPRAKGRPAASRTRIRPVAPAATRPAGILIAPVNIPTSITEESVAAGGAEDGVEGGVDYGIAGGFPGSVAGDALYRIIGEETASIRPAGEVRMPRLLKRVEPVYPEIARLSRIQGTVILEATTDIYGRVVAVKVLRSVPLLDQAARDAVRQWLYEPLVVNGRPRAVVFTVTLRFELK